MIQHITDYLKDCGFMVRSDWNRMDDCYDFMITRRSICAVGKFKRGSNISGFINDLISTWTREYVGVYGKQPDELPGHINNRCVSERNHPSIKDVIFNNPATIVFWSDGTKTVVKCQEGDTYDPEKGLTMAIAKKFFGNKGNYCNEINKWMDKYQADNLESTMNDICKALNNIKIKVPTITITPRTGLNYMKPNKE